MSIGNTESHPTIAFAMGDPAGISSELAARLLCDAEILRAARLVVFGDQRVLAAGASVAKVSPDMIVVDSESAVPKVSTLPMLVDLRNCDPAKVTRGKAELVGGKFASENFRRALLFANAALADGVFFTPFNKAAMRMALPGYDDEIRFVKEAIQSDASSSEFNILGSLWNARVTSHISLEEVPRSITRHRILEALELANSSLAAAGIDKPRIAVAGLNPHAGDGGTFGREEIDTIEPAVVEARSAGIAAQGPYPADTVFLRAKNGDFDAVLTMYHDQGQIAMKLLGFDRGVTLIGGFPFPICTPAHGTAYEIAGKGVANLGASWEALLLAIRMSALRSSKRMAAA